jgi:hypothetical protein
MAILTAVHSPRSNEKRTRWSRRRRDFRRVIRLFLALCIFDTKYLVDFSKIFNQNLLSYLIGLKLRLFMGFVFCSTEKCFFLSKDSHIQNLIVHNFDTKSSVLVMSDRVILIETILVQWLPHVALVSTINPRCN